MIEILLSPTHPDGKRLRRQIAVITTVMATLIAFLTLLPVGPPIGFPRADKFYHLVAFAALTAPCALLYPRALIWILPAAIIFGGAIEIIQPYAGRQADWADFFANALGVASGTSAGLALRLILKRLIQSSESQAQSQ